MKKTTKWLITAVMLCATLAVGAISASAEVEISEACFPDQYFREALKPYDTNNDNILQDSEIEAVTSMTIENTEISNLNGIYCFTNLKELKVTGNKSLTDLNLVENKALETLDCSGNALSDLIITNLSNLVTLNFSNNRLMSIILQGNESLKTIDCSNNSLSEIATDFSPSLETLDCSSNQITSLLLDMNPSLTYLKCDNNQITNIEFGEGGRERLTTFIHDHNYELGICTFCGERQSTGLAIDETNFPSQNFRSYILNPANGINTDGDENLSPAEIEAVTELNLNAKSCGDLTGIEYFTNLEKLVCTGNNLDTLDVRYNTKLTYLDCCFNYLSYIDLSNNAALTYLDCTENAITEISFASDEVKNNLIASDAFKHDCVFIADTNICSLCGKEKPAPTTGKVIVLNLTTDYDWLGDNEYTVDLGKEFTLTPAEFEGYTFEGWYAYDYYNDIDKFLSNDYTYTFTPTEEEIFFKAKYIAPTPLAKVTITGIGGAKFYVDNADTAQDYYIQEYPVGTELTLKADNESRFNAWVNDNDKIISTDPVLTVTVNAVTSIKLMYKSEPAEGTAFVEYVSDYGQILQCGSFKANDDIKEPSVPPSKAGYTFAGWNPSVDDIKAQITDGATHITVKPTYTAKEETHTVTINYMEQNSAIAESETLTVKDGSVITLTAKDIDGYYFSVWESNGDYISTKKNCFMLVTSDISVNAEYLTDTPQEADGIITITNIYTSTENGIPKLSFAAMRSVSERYTVIENGIIYGIDPSLNDENTLVLDGGANIAKGQSNKNDNDGIFVQNITATGNEGTTVYARGYMIVKDTELNKVRIIYSEIKSGSYNDYKQQ